MVVAAALLVTATVLTVASVQALVHETAPDSSFSALLRRRLRRLSSPLSAWRRTGSVRNSPAAPSRAMEPSVGLVQASESWLSSACSPMANWDGGGPMSPGAGRRLRRDCEAGRVIRNRPPAVGE